MYVWVFFLKSRFLPPSKNNSSLGVHVSVGEQTGDLFRVAFVQQQSRDPERDSDRYIFSCYNKKELI